MLATMLRIVCCLFAVSLALADTPATLKWAQLKNLTKQWNISYALTTEANKAVFVPHNCSSQLATAPCNVPPMSKTQNDRIRVSFQLKNSTQALRTFNGAPPQAVVVKMCYSPASFADRPWRKPKPVIVKDTSCPYKLGKVAWANITANSSVTFNFNTTSDMPSAGWYVKLVVMCQDGTSAGSACQYDDTNSTSNYFTTHKQDAVGPGLIAAAAVCSAVGPIIFAAWFITDAIHRKNK